MPRLSKRKAADFIGKLSLTRGPHRHPSLGVSLLEAVTIVNGDHFCQFPEDTCPVAGGYFRSLDPAISDVDRQRMRHFILPLSRSTTSVGREAQRGWMLMNWALRTCLPSWLKLAKIPEELVADLQRYSLTAAPASHAATLKQISAIDREISLRRSTALDRFSAEEVMHLATFCGGGPSLDAAKSAAGSVAEGDARQALASSIWQLLVKTIRLALALNARSTVEEQALALQLDSLTVVESLITSNSMSAAFVRRLDARATATIPNQAKRPIDSTALALSA